VTQPWSVPVSRELRHYVARAVSYSFTGLPPGTHVGAPSGYLTLIVAVGEPLAVSELGEEPRRYDALVAGLQPVPSLVHHDGSMEGIQLDLTPAGARALLGVPAAALDATVPLDDLLHPADRGLASRISETADWGRRGRLLLQALSRRLGEASLVEPVPEVREAWRLLHASSGAVPVSQVAAHVGWSPRHLGQRFRAETGVTPKAVARVARFQRARGYLVRGSSPAEVAARCGYADQAHLTREWRALCGSPPAAWLRTDHLAVSAPGRVGGAGTWSREG
jgi:AraC-like DNA-binding protein